MPTTEILNYIRSQRKTFDVHQFCGKWYIVGTSLALWARRIKPSVTYTMMEPGVRTKLLEIVHYGTFAKAQKQVIGVDDQDRIVPNLFRWRGRTGFSWLLTNDWAVLDHDPACQTWAVTYFSSMCLTPAYINIYARQPQLSAGKLKEIVQRLRNDQFFAPYAQNLYTPG